MLGKLKARQEMEIRKAHDSLRKAILLCVSCPAGGRLSPDLPKDMAGKKGIAYLSNNESKSLYGLLNRLLE